MSHQPLDPHDAPALSPPPLAPERSATATSSDRTDAHRIPATQPAATPGDKIDPGPRLARLIVCRESAQHDGALLNRVVRHAWERNRHAPHLDRIRRAGLDPVRLPERCRFPVATLIGAQFLAGLFVLGHVGWVFSAAASPHDSLDDNEFTAMLRPLIIRHRPVVVDAVDFPRPLRNPDAMAHFGNACSQFVDEQHAGTHVVDFTGDRAWTRQVWLRLCRLPATEQDSHRRRLNCVRAVRNPTRRGGC